MKTIIIFFCLSNYFLNSQPALYHKNNIDGKKYDTIESSYYKEHKVKTKIYWFQYDSTVSSRVKYEETELNENGTTSKYTSYLKNGKKGISKIFKYDDSDNLVEEKTKYHSINSQTITKYQYDYKNRIINISSIDRGKVTISAVYSYNDSLNYISESENLSGQNDKQDYNLKTFYYNSNNYLSKIKWKDQTSIYSYNDTGYVIFNYYKDSLKSTEVNKYNKDGKITETSILYPDSMTYINFKATYNENGIPKEEIYYTKENVISHRYLYEYDKKGLLITKDTYRLGDIFDTRTIYKYY